MITVQTTGHPCPTSYEELAHSTFSCLLAAVALEKGEPYPMATKKNSMFVPRRVWRMTTDAPQGEYLDLVPKEVHVDALEAPKRPAESDRPTAYGAVSLPRARSDATQSPSSMTSSQPLLSSRPTVRPDELTESPAVPSSRARVLKPAQVENWQSSSFDLFTGCSVREVTDTIPGELFDELFAPGPSPSTPPKRRR